MKLIVISGSARPERRSHQVALEVQKRLEAKGHEVELLDVLELNFPLLKETFAKDPNATEGMKQLSESIRNCDGLVIVSPEHNGSYSGALKNTMDYYYSEYTRKPFGIVAVSNGMLGGISAAKNLLHYTLVLQGIPLSKYLLTPKVQNLFTDGKLTDEDYGKRMDAFLEEYLWLAKTISKGSAEN